MRDSWVLVAYPVISMFEDEQAKCRAQMESGGILIGCYRGPHIEVTGFTKPATKDLRQAYRFIKQDPKHQRVATRAWLQSGGKDTYVGEWHSHPIGRPQASAIDLSTWRDLMAVTRRVMIFVIVSPAGWALFRGEKRFARLPFHQLVKLEQGQSGLVFRTR